MSAPLLERLRALVGRHKQDAQATDPKTVAILPPGAMPCRGISLPTSVRPISQCRGCLRYRSQNAQTDDSQCLIPSVMFGAEPDAFWCSDRIAG